jgi:DNA polymerase-3 subunit epsilon
LVRTPDPNSEYEPRFSEREEADHAYYFATRLEALQRGSVAPHELLNDVNAWPTPQVSTVADLRDALALALGKQLEPNTDAALSVYQRGESVDCSERIIRLLLASGRKEEARGYLERCIAWPSSDEEALFASDIYERKFNKKRTSALTDLLRDSPVIDIDDAFRGSPEWAAVAFFERQGKRAFRAENRFWRTLFGLLFWDLIFESDASALGSPFERLPAVLTERRFFATHKRAIEERLLLLDSRQGAQRHMLKVSARYFGVPNGIFRWRQPIIDAIHAFLAVADPAATSQVLRLFCKDYASAKHGYPDLLVIDGTEVNFVEIKADGDQLRRNQMLRLTQLKACGFNASVTRIRWVLEPTQPYVVVDVETTGGKGKSHRITELGAVKVLGDTVVDTFHTLINPDRAIPPGITRLTGISNAMVASAPVFADIADAFSTFSSGAIFVAHNVEFDYGFVSSEFERLGRRFRRPKLCTCASMRKLFQGKESYGLASLCSEYQIPLTNHHRALCDAKAAAELLFIINDKRRELLES